MSSNYDDDTERLAVCQEEVAVACRHRDCLRANVPACANMGRPEEQAGPKVYMCLLPSGHGGLWHQNGPGRWSTCRRHPMCDCPRHQAGTIKPEEPHVCPEPQILVVAEDLMRRMQEIVDDMSMSGDPGPDTYATLRLILDKMEKGFRIP
jgi:hypothetical protein